MILKESEIERILVINLDSMSEVILSMPVTRALKENYPNAKISMLVTASAKDIAEMNVYIENVFVYDQYGEHKGISGFFSIVTLLKSNEFALAIAMNNSMIGALIAWSAGIKYRVGYDKGFTKLFLTHPATSQKDRVQHQTINNLQVLGPLGITTTNTALTLRIDEATAKIIDMTMFPIDQRPNITFCPINRRRLKGSLGLEKIIVIINELEKFSNVYLIGGIQEQSELLEIAEKAEIAKERVLAGKLNVKELAVFLKHTQVMLSVEACTMYMAQALNIPVVALFGPTNALIYGPCGNSNVILLHKTNCMPCSNKNECLHNKCMEEISVNEIVDKVAERLK